MADEPLVATAKALVTHLNAGSYAESFTAVRSYDPEVAIEDLDTLKCKVVAVGYPTAEMADMGGSMRYEVAVDVGFQKRFVVADQESGGEIKLASVDAIVNLCSEVYKDLIRSEGLSGYSAATIAPPKRERGEDVSTIRTTYGAVHDKKGNLLRNHRQATAIFRVVYEVYEAPL